MPFKLQTIDGETVVAKLILETKTNSLITNKINYLILSLCSTEHQLVKYSLGQCDVIIYITRAGGASEFIQTNENLQYEVLLDYINQTFRPLFYSG